MAEDTFKQLLDAVRQALADLEDGEAGHLPYCDDPEDGCSEQWWQLSEDFEKAANRLLVWLGRKAEKK